VQLHPADEGVPIISCFFGHGHEMTLVPKDVNDDAG